MTEEDGRQFPLPPRKDSNAPKRALRRTRRLPQRAFRAVTAAPGKIVQRANQELYRRNAELAARNKTLALLRKLDEISLAALGMREIAQRMTKAIAMELGYDLATIAVVKKKGAALQWLAAASSVPWIVSTLRSIDISQLSLTLSKDSPASQALEKEVVQYAEHPQDVYPSKLVERLSKDDSTSDVEEVRHTILFPLRFGQQFLGLLTLSSSRSFLQASKYEQESVSGIVGLVSLAMYKAKIYQDLEVATGKLEKANEQLQDLDKAKSEFLSIASHQLYTPLTALRGYLSMLQEGDFGSIAPKQKPIMDILDKSAQRLISLIKNLLDISRIEAGRLELNLESTDLVPITKVLVQDLMPNAMKKNLKLLFHEPNQPLPHVVVDRERIRQVMLNFIDNAIKYTSRGHIDVKVVAEKAEVVFSVSDTGKGLRADEIKKLFTKFTRVGGADRFHTEGTGLGLYVAKQIVQEHHGTLDVKSPGKGKGSVFSMRLPVEGAKHSLRLGEKTTVTIEAGKKSE